MTLAQTPDYWPLRADHRPTIAGRHRNYADSTSACALRLNSPNAPERQRRANLTLVARALTYRTEHPEASWTDTGAVIGEHPERLKRLCRRYRPT